MKGDFKNLRYFLTSYKQKYNAEKNYFKILLPQGAGAFGNSIEKEPQKPRPKLKKYVSYIFTENICSSYNPMQVVVFCKNALIL